MNKGQQTRERILGIAEAAILSKGFSNTSIDEVIAAADITKSGFFYHFKDKTALAKALLIRYIDYETKMINEIFDRASELNEDPLHALLIGLKIFSETMGDINGGHPGCMMAAVAYHEKQFNDEVRQINRDGMMSMRNRFHTVLLEIAERYPPKVDVDLEALADMASVISDGGIILSRVFADPKILANQLMLYRSYIRMIFLGP